MAEFVLHVPDIDETGRDYAFELSPAWLDAHLRDANLRHDPAFGPGVLHVHAQDNGGGEYLVTGSLCAHVVTECSRCLGDAELAVDASIATLFARSAARPGSPDARHERHERHERHDADALEDDELPREHFGGNEIALDELIREHIVLEVPMQPLCSEQCQGIDIPEHLRPPADVFPTAGTVDPRLAPLQRLRDNVPPVSEPKTPAAGARPSQLSRAAEPTLNKSAKHRPPKPKSKTHQD